MNRLAGKPARLAPARIAAALALLCLAAPALARRAAVPFPPPASGVLEICKVAGPGVAVGMPFTFTAGSTVTVPAATPPAGECVTLPALPLGANLTVAEQIPGGYAVSSIVVTPPSQQSSAPDLAAGSVGVTIGPGVTKVTYTDYRSSEETGWLEICKQGRGQGDFSFTIAPGGAGPITVPAGACSPAIQVPAGQVAITESPSGGGAMLGCSTLPPGQQGPCAPPTSTVTVAPGDVSTETIAIIVNGPPDARARPPRR